LTRLSGHVGFLQPYVLDSKLLILEGKGRFKNVRGNLRAIGTVDFGSGAVQWKVWGTRVLSTP
jgi:hypothetical protein